MSDTITPVWQWTHDGKRVLLLRYVSMEYKSYGGFTWPEQIGAEIECPDWNPEPVCGGGFHGWPWGIGIGSGKDPVFVDTFWQVISADPKDIVWVENDKAKCRKVRLEHVGSWWECIAKIEAGRTTWIQHASRGSASATGERGSASATGWSGSASATGWSGSASATGWSGSASATGWRGSASATGWRGSASATGESGSASATGERGSASATGGSGSASATGGSGSASATGWRGAAITTGEYSTVECGKDGIAVSTADEVTWIARPGAVFVHRYEGIRSTRSLKIATFKGTKATDGERITFKCGKIVKRVMP